ncbi:MAG: lipid biosynthesis B12-binding/radical SAM protein [Bacteroidales bacterium]
MRKHKQILLISANRHKEPYPVYPLGLSYLKSYLENTLPGFQTEIIDCNLVDMEQLGRLIKMKNPDYVGISFRNVDGANSLKEGNFFAGYREIVDVVRANTTAPLIIGGAGFSIFPSLFMAKMEADYGIVGEGEESLRQLIEMLDQQKLDDKIEGLVLPELPQQDILPHQCYLDRLDLRFEEDLVDYYWKFSGMLNIQTKRGCPYNCVYCSYPTIDGRQVRTLDAELVVDNMARLKRDKNINYFFFTDSVFNLKDSYNQELAECLIKADLNISWGAYFSPRNIKDEAMGLYKKSGLTHVEFGTESFSDEVLQSYGKNFTFEKILSASDICLKNDIYYAHFLILGGYGESERSLRETFENSKKIRYSVFFPYVGMRVYPQTELHRIVIAENIISPDHSLVDPYYYVAPEFDLDLARRLSVESGKAWVFPDDPQSEMMDLLRLKRKKKGPIWEYLRKP